MPCKGATAAILLLAVMAGATHAGSAEASERVYAVVASWYDDRVQVIDITDPYNLAPAGAATDGVGGFTELDRAYGVATAHIGGHTYAVVTSSDDHGVQVIDITDPHNLVPAGAATDGVGGFTHLEGALDVAIAHIGGYTYAVVASSDDDGVQVIDITDPHNLAPAGAATDGVGGFTNLEEARDVAIAHIGGYTYAVVTSYNDHGVQVIDITDPHNLAPAGAATDGAGGFTHLERVRAVAIYTPGGVPTQPQSTAPGDQATAPPSVQTACPTEWRILADLSGANLEGCDLSNAALIGMDLRWANLQNANLTGAKLQNANLFDANLMGANLEGAMLQRANLWGADLSGAKLQNANLTGADLRGPDLLLWPTSGNVYVLTSAQDIDPSDLAELGLSLAAANLQNADLTFADLRWADLSGQRDMQNADLRFADLRGANLTGADLQNANLLGAKLPAESVGAQLRECPDLSSKDLSWCDLAGADLSGANLQNADLSHADLRESDLSNANLAGADLRFADLSGQRITTVIHSTSMFIPGSTNEISWSSADLTGADLSGATLRGANLTGVDLSDTVLTGADFRGYGIPDTDLVSGSATFVSDDPEGTGASLGGLAWKDVVDEYGITVMRYVDLSGVDLSSARLADVEPRSLLSRVDLTDAPLKDPVGATELFGVTVYTFRTWGDLFGRHVSDVDLSGADLSSVDLSDAGAIGVDLSGVELPPGVDRSDVSMTDVDLTDVDLGLGLSWVDLSGANLHGAKLAGADLTRSVLVQANLHKADLSGAKLDYADLSGADLGRADLTEARLLGTVMTRTNMSLVKLPHAYISHATIEMPLAQKADFSGARIENTMMPGANLYGANFTNAFLYNVDMRGSNLVEVRMNGAKVYDTDISYSAVTDVITFLSNRDIRQDSEEWDVTSNDMTYGGAVSKFGRAGACTIPAVAAEVYDPLGKIKKVRYAVTLAEKALDTKAAAKTLGDKAVKEIREAVGNVNPTAVGGSAYIAGKTNEAFAGEPAKSGGFFGTVGSIIDKIPSITSVTNWLADNVLGINCNPFTEPHYRGPDTLED